MTEKEFDEIVKILSYHTKKVGTLKNEKPCRVKINGKYFYTFKNKTVWKNKTCAKLALYSYLEDAIYDVMPEIESLYSADRRERIKEVSKILEEKKLIEYVELEGVYVE